jgi:hypothetical protein
MKAMQHFFHFNRTTDGSRALDSKLREMYPEIVNHHLSLSLIFDRDKDAWIVKLVKGKHELTTHFGGKILMPVSRGFNASIREFKYRNFWRTFNPVNRHAFTTEAPITQCQTAWLQ